MGIGVSVFLLAIGAVLTFALESSTRVSGINLDTVGVILMIVGIIGLVTSMLFWNSWGGFNRGAGGVATERTVVRDREVI